MILVFGNQPLAMSFPPRNGDIGYMIIPSQANAGNENFFKFDSTNLNATLIHYTFLDDPTHPFNGTVGISIPDTVFFQSAGTTVAQSITQMRVQLNVEFALNPTWLGYSENYCINQNSRKEVQIAVQCWNKGLPTSLNLNGSVDMEELWSVNSVFQKNSAPITIGTDLLNYYPRFLATGMVTLPVGTTYLTWSLPNRDIPFDGTPSNGQPLTTVAGYQVNAHQLYAI
jgi:hypothetical protein